MESVAYVLLLLCLGELPWRCNGPTTYERPAKMARRMYSAKVAFTGESLPIDVPEEYSDVLGTSRTVKRPECPAAVVRLRARFQQLVARLQQDEDERSPLDWTLKDAVLQPTDTDEDAEPPREGVQGGAMEGFGGAADENKEKSWYTDSYYGYDNEAWPHHHERPGTLTLPPDETELLDGQVPLLGEVRYVWDHDV